MPGLNYVSLRVACDKVKGFGAIYADSTGRTERRSQILRAGLRDARIMRADTTHVAWEPSRVTWGAPYRMGRAMPRPDYAARDGARADGP